MTHPLEKDLEYAVEMIAQSEIKFLSPMGPLILAAAALEIASDSRSFARIFGIAHALVIRECVSLSEELHLIEPYKRADKSQRLFYDITEQGWSIIPRDI